MNPTMFSQDLLKKPIIEKILENMIQKNKKKLVILL